MSNITTLIEAYGKAMTPKEVAIFLGVDYRTVIKYADRWGGVEVSPGKYRFFENFIRRKIDAKFNNEKRKKEVESEYNGKWQKKREAISRQLDGNQTQCSIMGKGGKRKAGERTDRHELLKSA